MSKALRNGSHSFFSIASGILNEGTVQPNTHSWYAFEAKSVESKLGTYFPDTNLDHRWDRYADNLETFIFGLLLYVGESDPTKVEKMRPQLEKISNYFNSSAYKENYEKIGLIERIASNFNEITPNFNELVSAITASFLAEGYKMKKDIMKTPFKIF